MADTAAPPPPAAPASGLPPAAGTNPLSRKLNKILETRLDNDKVGREAAEGRGGGRMSRQGPRAPTGSAAGGRVLPYPQFRCGAAGGPLQH